MKEQTNTQVVTRYFEAFETGNTAAVVELFHPDCTIISVRDAKRSGKELHGTYRTRGEAQDFISNINRLFTTKSFKVLDIADAGNNVVYAHGSFIHIVNATGKYFKSDWVQRCVIEEGTIKEYRFYEDSAAYHFAA